MHQSPWLLGSKLRGVRSVGLLAISLNGKRISLIQHRVWTLYVATYIQRRKHHNDRNNHNNIMRTPWHPSGFNRVRRRESFKREPFWRRWLMQYCSTAMFSIRILLRILEGGMSNIRYVGHAE